MQEKTNLFGLLNNVLDFDAIIIKTDNGNSFLGVVKKVYLEEVILSQSLIWSNKRDVTHTLKDEDLSFDLNKINSITKLQEIHKMVLIWSKN